MEIYYKIPAFPYHSYNQEESSTEENSALIKNRRQMGILEGVTCFTIKTKRGLFFYPQHHILCMMLPCTSVYMYTVDY